MTRLRWGQRPEIVCQQGVEMVTDYLEGALPPKLQRAADRHLADCPHCREYLEQMRLTIRMATRVGGQDVPDDVVEALTRAFADYRQEGGS
jgi:anti-sigma factor RsiW